MSPSRHAELTNTDELLELLDWVEMLTIGIKSAVGDMKFWDELTQRIADTERGVEFVDIYGGGSGTGASPLVHRSARTHGQAAFGLAAIRFAA